MEKEIKIKTPDKHIIYGTLNTSKKNSNILLIFVHGLTGHRDEHIFYNGCDSTPNVIVNQTMSMLSRSIRNILEHFTKLQEP